MGIQVDTLVKDKKTYEKEFIDFEFDGKHISDFGMVAVFDGDRHTFSSTSEFEDETSEVAGVNGQYFWGTKLKPLQMSFSLATDGMTEKQINAFKQHFQPGRYGEFIECATSNRKRYGRISKPTEFKMIPFKKEMNIGGKSFYVTEYKGEANIDFIFDDPYSYAIDKYFNKNIQTAEPWELKAAYEDGILFKDNNLFEQLIDKETLAEVCYNPSTTSSKPFIKLEIEKPFEIDESNLENIELPIYNYIFKDDINSANSDEKYSNITVSAISIKNAQETFEDAEIRLAGECKFTSPDVFYSYNKVLQIINDSADSVDKIQLQDKLREEITHYKVLKFALEKLNNNEVSEEEKFKTNWKKNFYKIFYTFFNMKPVIIDENTQEEIAVPFLTFILDSKTHQATIEYYLEKNKIPEKENCGEIMLSPYLELEGGDYLIPIEDSNIYPFVAGSCHFVDFTNSLNGLVKEGITVEYEYTYI